MTFKNLLKTTILLAAAYKIGELSGTIKCFNKVTDKYKDVLFEKLDFVTYEIFKGCDICRTEPTVEAEKGDK